jgi:hypothetical protein
VKLRKACGIYDIPYECLRHLPTRPVVHLAKPVIVFGSHIFPNLRRKQTWNLYQNQVRDPKSPQNLLSVRLFSTTGKLFERVILKIIQRHNEGKNNLSDASQFGFLANRITTLQQTINKQTTELLMPTIKCLQLRYSWISKNPLILYSTCGCCINYLKWNFWPLLLNC